MKLRLKIHPAGAALAALGLLLLPSAGMLAAAAAMALHEGGHVLAMALCGVRECRIELTPFGGVADVPGFERLPARRQCLIALAGVPVSAASAWLCLRFAPQTEFFRLFYRFSMGMALVNVLPVWPLDGARVLLCGARWFGREEPARRAMLWLSYLLAVGMLALGLAGVFQREPVAVPAAAVSGLRGMAEQHGRKSAGRGCGTGRRVLAQRKTAAGAALCLPGNAGKVGTASSAARPSRGAHGASLQV